MLSGLSFMSAFVFSTNSLILSGFQLTSFHFAEANLVPRTVLKKLKTYYSPSSYSEKMCWGQVKVFCGFAFLCVQLSKKITKCFLKGATKL